jgi:hypothetical protein
VLINLQAMAAENTGMIQLTDQKPSWKLDQPHRGRDINIKPNINTFAHPWAVLLNDNVYVKDTQSRIDPRAGDGIWQYSIKGNTWSPHPQPGLFGFKDYTLTVFHSQLVCIGGFESRPDDLHQYTPIRSVYSWNGHEWKDGDVQQIPENVELPSINELSTSSDDTCLYLAWQKGDKVLIYQYSGGRGKWEERKGPYCKSSGSRIEISVFKETIFLTEHNDNARTVIHKASVSSLSSSSALGWTEISWSSRVRDEPHSFFSNLTFMGQKIMLLVPFPSSPRSAMLCVLETIKSSDHVYWNKIGCLQIPWKLDSHPSIFSLQNESLLIIGSSGDPLRASAKVCVHKR